MEVTTVTFQSLSNEVIAELQCQPSQSAISMKQELCEALGKPQEHSHLLHILLEGKVLDDGDELQSLGISGGVLFTAIWASPSRLSLVPDFGGIYLGFETENRGTWKFEMVIDSADFHEVEGSEHLIEGVVHWRCVDGPFDVDPTLRGRERVRGTVQEDGSLQLQGHTTEPERGLIAKCSYDLRLSAGGTELQGRFKGMTSCDSDFALRRLEPGDGVDWYAGRRTHIATCRHTLADEVRESTGVAIALEHGEH